MPSFPKASLHSSHHGTGFQINTDQGGDIGILYPDDDERIRALSGIDNTRPYPDTTLHERFHQTADLHPLRPAVIEADGTPTSYREIQRQVRHIAAFLRNDGLQPEQVVAIYLQRSPELVAALFGILEAGGAFLLLDSGLPNERICRMLEQAEVSLLISSAEMPALPGFPGNLLDIDELMRSDVSGYPVNTVPSEPSSLAYVIFTSGSTGIPKGAMVEHRNILNRLFYTRDALDFGIDDRTLQKSPLSFDVCLTEFLLPMITGGAIVLADPDAQIGMQRIADLVERHRATYLHFAPSLLRAFLEVPDVRKVNGILRMIRCGGESLPETVMQDCLSSLDAVLHQSYGPAEAAIAVTLWRCHTGHGHPKPPIGTPNANVDILILDKRGQPVPPGEPGELWIGGAQTGRGYINNPEETTRRFVDDPLEPGSGRRYYRTGDLARFLPDGNLLFIGRIDSQVKVRGVRIELGDVTASLLRCAGVREAVVLAEADGEGSNRLRAWVTRKDGVVVSESSIRSSMTELLPGYMVPFRIHLIDAIPLTTHGKTDHRTLQALAAADSDAPMQGLPLASPTEQGLASLWSEILRVPVQYRDADFFRLGGHSLMVIRMLDRIKAIWGVRPDISEIFLNPTLESMALSIDQRMIRVESSEQNAPIEPVRAWDTGRGKHIFAFVGGAGSEEEFTKYHLIGRVLGEDWRIHILPDPETSRGRFPTTGLDVLAHRYTKAILSICQQEKAWLLGDCIGGHDAVAVATALQEAGVENIGLIVMDSRAPSPTPDEPQKSHSALESYRLMRDKGTPWQEAWFRIFLSVSRFKPVRSLIHVRPRSKSQVARMALEYRLFEPEYYARHSTDPMISPENAFMHYMEKGWGKGQPPSSRFNVYRYARHATGFSMKDDEPIIHALLHGFMERYVRNRVLAYVEKPNLKSDLMSARRQIRDNHVIPQKFKGELQILASEDYQKKGGSQEWEKHINGNIHIHNVEGTHSSYLKEKLTDTARTLLKILEA